MHHVTKRSFRWTQPTESDRQQYTIRYRCGTRGGSSRLIVCGEEISRSRGSDFHIAELLLIRFTAIVAWQNQNRV